MTRKSDDAVNTGLHDVQFVNFGLLQRSLDIKPSRITSVPAKSGSRCLLPSFSKLWVRFVSGEVQHYSGNIVLAELYLQHDAIARGDGDRDTWFFVVVQCQCYIVKTSVGLLLRIIQVRLKHAPCISCC